GLYPGARAGEGGGLREARPAGGGGAAGRAPDRRHDAMKITVCELPDEPSRRDAAWAELVRHLRAQPTDVVVLPEMPFCEWEMFRKRTVDLAAWRSAWPLATT